MSNKANIFIVGAKRTAFGTFGGSLSKLTATDLAEKAAKATFQGANLSRSKVDHIVFGNVIQSSADAAYLSRHVGLRLNIPVETPAVTINRLCGSGFQSVIDGVHQILVGDSQVVLAGGTESMSQAPFVVRNVRFGSTLGAKYEFEDSLWQGLTDAHIKTPMALTAEKLGAQYKITRKEVDEYAAQSQTRWRLAANAGYFKAEIAPVELKTHKGVVQFDRDEHPRESTVEQLGKLKSIFQKDGLVTAGTASGICDGAAAVLIANEEAVNGLKVNPMARIVAYHVVGCDPSIMGIGPAEAIRGVCKKSGVKLEDVDLIEVNEAFAAQALAVKKELNIEMDRFNVNGGAIALGHPLAASGTRLMCHLTYELKRRNARYAIGSACIGGGQGIAILIERV